MDEKLKKELRLLKGYTIFLTIVLSAAVLMGFRASEKNAHLEEIDVERINVVEKDGKLKLVISNQERFPDPIMNGQVLKRRGDKSPGMLFYNDRGDEVGGLIFGGSEKDGKVNAGAAFLFDQFNQDQTIGLMYNESEGRRFAGLNVWDRPDTPLLENAGKLEAIEKMKDGPEKREAMKKLGEEGAFGARRVFVGKGRDKAALVVLSDTKGNPRIKMMVDEAGRAKIDFLNEKGNVVSSLPEKLQEKQ